MMIESEIDRAFPYLDELNKLIEKSDNTIQKNNYHPILSFFGIRKNLITHEPIITIQRKRLVKSKTFFKDGYDFSIKLYLIFDEANPKYFYYEFFANIKYGFEVRKREFYKKFYNKDEAKKYYEDMEGVFRLLKRRELMERLFKQKLEEINNSK